MGDGELCWPWKGKAAYTPPSNSPFKCSFSLLHCQPPGIQASSEGHHNLCISAVLLAARCCKASHYNQLVHITLMRCCALGTLHRVPCMPMCVFWDVAKNYSTVCSPPSTCSSYPWAGWPKVLPGPLGTGSAGAAVGKEVHREQRLEQGSSVTVKQNKGGTINFEQMLFK